MRSKLILFDPWVWKMAWRDSRTSRRRLLLAMASVTLGVAVLVAITSFQKNLEQTIEHQSKALLGADLVIKGRQPFAQETVELMKSLDGEQSHQISFSSMVYFPKSQSTRLARIRALEGDFPFYGKLETEPAGAADLFKGGPRALVDDSLLLQFDAHVGDPIKIGAQTYQVVARLKKIPGEAVAIGMIHPRVYIPMSTLAQTKLIQKGSIVRYRAFFKFEPERDVEQLIETLQPHLRNHKLRVDTVKERKERLGGIMSNLSRFLNLVGFIALLLGGVGVASGIHIYTKQKVPTVAILRCVGAKASQTLTLYVIQAMAMGIPGVILGVGVGIGVQGLLPMVLGDFLPVKITGSIYWPALLLGMVIGLGVALLFALLPLISLRHTSPLLTLRTSFRETPSESKDPLRSVLFGLIALGTVVFALLQTDNWVHGLGFAAGLGLAFGLLVGVAKLMITLVRRYTPSSWSYVWRQGLANLYRPNNQTLVLMLSLGLGTFLIMTLHLSQRMLLEKVSLASGDDRPNMVLFEIQADQRKGLVELLKTFQLSVIQETPVVTMRLLSVAGRSVDDIRKDPNSGIPNWAIGRQYRSTYRDHLVDTETLVAGSWNGSRKQRSGVVSVSVEKGIAEDLQVTLGDELVFDIYGVPFTTTVGSIREVDWQRFQPNFFMVFPRGVLEGAPQFYVQVTRVPSNAISAQLQRAVVQKFPNVSTIDLTLIMNTVDSVLAKVSFAIRFVALFSILTGLMVLAGTVLTSRYQRLRESVLLRTLGASRAQIRNIMLVEYLWLGGMAALSGIILALAASWALAYFVFDVVYRPSGVPIFIALLIVTGLTTLVGLLNSRGICDRPPLEVLRAEA